MKTLIYPISILLITMIGCTQSSTPKEAEEAEAVVQVKKGRLEGKTTWRGIVRSANRVEIRADKKLKIGKTHVKNLEPVKKGQLLIEVDTSDARKREMELRDGYKTLNLDFESLKVRFQQSAKNLSRKKSLSEKGILATKEFEEAERDYKILENELKAKELEVQKMLRDISQVETELKASSFMAPNDGVVIGIWEPQSENQEINPGQSLATLIDPKTFALWVQVEETNLSLVTVGQEAQVRLDILPGKTLRGSIFEVSSNASDGNARVKTYTMGIAFDGAGLGLKEGFAGEGTLIYAKKENVITVPLAAIKYLEGKNYLVVSNAITGIRKTVPVSIGVKTGTEAEILSGVTENEFVVVSN